MYHMNYSESILRTKVPPTFSRHNTFIGILAKVNKQQKSVHLILTDLQGYVFTLSK